MQSCSRIGRVQPMRQRCRMVFGHSLHGKDGILRSDGLLASDLQPALRSRMASRLILGRMGCESASCMGRRLLVVLWERLRRGFGHILAAMQSGRRERRGSASRDRQESGRVGEVKSPLVCSLMVRRRKLAKTKKQASERGARANTREWLPETGCWSEG